MLFEINNENEMNIDCNIFTPFRKHIMDVASNSSSYRLYHLEHFFNEDFYEQFGFLEQKNYINDFHRMIKDQQIPVARIRRYKERLYYIDWESALEIHG